MGGAQLFVLRKEEPIVSQYLAANFNEAGKLVKGISRRNKKIGQEENAFYSIRKRAFWKMRKSYSL